MYKLLMPSMQVFFIYLSNSICVDSFELLWQTNLGTEPLLV